MDIFSLEKTPGRYLFKNSWSYTEEKGYTLHGSIIYKWQLLGNKFSLKAGNNVLIGQTKNKMILTIFQGSEFVFNQSNQVDTAWRPTETFQNVTVS